MKVEAFCGYTPEPGIDLCCLLRGWREDDGLFGKITRIDEAILLAVIAIQTLYISSTNAESSRIKISIERRRGVLLPTFTPMITKG